MDQIKTDASYQVKKNIVTFTLILNWILTGWLMLYGNPQNSLHTSALAWAFGTSIFTIAAYVFGVYLDKKVV